jgi:hypothetical protein
MVKKSSRLVTLGTSLAMAGSLELGPGGTHFNATDPMERGYILEGLPCRLPRILEAVVYLQKYSRLTTAANIGVIAELPARHAGAYCRAITEMGLFLPAAEQIREYSDTAYEQPMRPVIVRRGAIDQISYVSYLTAAGIDQLGLDYPELREEILDGMQIAAIV